MFLLVAICLIIIGSITLIILASGPVFTDKVTSWKEKQEQAVSVELDKMFYDKNPKKIVRLYFILPPLFGLLGFLILQSFLLVGGGILLGLFIPNLILKIRNSRRRQKFNHQILDTIMVLSSSLKSGLSLLQALEVIVEEMPQPMSQEVGWAVKEHKMGKTIEDSLKHLNQRMYSEELSLLINSILVARETGGDLTKVFSRLSTTIRDNRKLKENIRTLTLQGRMQGVIMSVLPFLFIWWVLTFNRQHFDIMLQTDTGRLLLFAAVILQAVGMILIRRFSMIRI